MEPTVHRVPGESREVHNVSPAFYGNGNSDESARERQCAAAIYVATSSYSSIETTRGL